MSAVCTWTRSMVVHAICAEAQAGHDLSYTRTEKRSPALLHAAQRLFGHWGAAIEAAGLNYDEIRRYRKWTRERVIARIQEWHRRGCDLSWNHVATELDPPLAAAALHGRRFRSWRDALRAAGIDPEEVTRYRQWTIPLIQQELLDLLHDGVSLDQKTLAQEAPSLLAAVYRIGGGLTVQTELLHQRLAMQRLKRSRLHQPTLLMTAGYHEQAASATDPQTAPQHRPAYPAFVD